MKHVRIRITASGREAEIHPMYDVWANATFIERTSILQWNYTGDTLGILHVATGDADAFEEAITEIPEVMDYDIVRAGGDVFYVYIKDALTDALQALFAPITHDGLVVVPPVRYHEDGSVTFSVFGPDAAIQSALDAVPQPVTVTVEEISGLAAAAVTAGPHLSERQREAIEAAYGVGYYEIPREASQADVAAILDLAPSTAAEHLQKAESKLVSSVFA